VLAEKLAIGSREGPGRLAWALSGARVDLNPHQVEAAAFALDSLRRGGCVLADEVGLGKTIEAGLVLSQLMAEGKRRFLIICPASLRMQWKCELEEKFEIHAELVDGATAHPPNPFDRSTALICSLQFAATRAGSLVGIPWDLVVIDEAHRLRNAHRTTHKTGQALKGALRLRPKILLTATPLQNSLLELFGLVSILDERLLGPEQSFRLRHESGVQDEQAIEKLKGALSQVVFRTLRRQVREYVRFTHRRSIVEDFAPSPEEQALYDKVSDYLRRPDISAIEPNRRMLLTLVYRKLLASSSFAIAPTLRKLAERLRAEGSRGATLPTDGFDSEPLRAFLEQEDEWLDGPSDPKRAMPIEKEIEELERYATLAEGIQINAKGEALIKALDRTFTVARAHQWPEKAVVFTESKRTQAYLFRLLSERGYREQISLLSGDGAGPAQRSGIIEEFRQRTQILLSTEAGAEGLNLQFCNLVVNYDLPWNPQRIEQRIGRCHRYGQERDVLVINFLNRQNAADARLLELLEEKLHLFDGVFGASDEILGSLEDGIDFEKRVLSIYQSCRTSTEIDAAFDALRADLENRIQDRMTETRSLLIDRFDGEVRRRLRLVEAEALEAIAHHREEGRALASSVVEGGAEPTPAQVIEIVSQIRSAKAPEISYLKLDVSFLPSKCSKLAGKEGWWLVYRFETTGLVPKPKLVHLILLREGDGFRTLAMEDAQHFLSLPAAAEMHRRPTGISIASAHEAALSSLSEEAIRTAEAASAGKFDDARERLDRYAEESLVKLRQATDLAHQRWTSAREDLIKIDDPLEQRAHRSLISKREREYRRELSCLRAEEEARYAEKDQLTATLAQQAKVTCHRTLIATAYFWL
jgi:superfamily II DNA or RNA helicase